MLGSAVRRRLRIPFACVAVFVVATCIYLWTATPLYEARATITGRPEETQSISGLTAGLGLSMLRGLGRGTNLTNYDKLIKVLTSVDTAAHIAANNELMAHLFPTTWDASSKRWKPPQGVRAVLGNAVNRLFGLPGWTAPTVEPVVKLMESRLRIVANDAGRYHTLSFRHKDPSIAREVLELSIGSADRLLRERDRRMVDENVNFLRERVRNEEIVALRDVLSKQLGEQFVRAAMLANSSPYSYEVLESLNVSSYPVSPRPLLSVILAVLAGVMVGCALIFLLPHRRPIAAES
jgi:uncharacterized protein involved in exopolysaccharide biosynthesis